MLYHPLELLKLPHCTTRYISSLKRLLQLRWRSSLMAKTNWSYLEALEPRIYYSPAALTELDPSFLKTCINKKAGWLMTSSFRLRSERTYGMIILSRSLRDSVVLLKCFSFGLNENALGNSNLGKVWRVFQHGSTKSVKTGCHMLFQVLQYGVFVWWSFNRDMLGPFLYHRLIRYWCIFKRCLININQH